MSAEEARRRAEELHGVLSHYRSAGECIALEDGRYNKWFDLVCDPAQTSAAGVLLFPAHLEAGLAAAAAREARAKCKAKRQVAWLRVNELSFNGNDYIGVALVFQRPQVGGPGALCGNGRAKRRAREQYVVSRALRQL
jgi:hypothetical protein